MKRLLIVLVSISVIANASDLTSEKYIINSDVQILLPNGDIKAIGHVHAVSGDMIIDAGEAIYWIGPYISIHFLSLNPLLVRRRRYSRGERYPSALCGCHSL
ncbi:Uncharacterised protein [Citrobacter freundii]|nr:Uncharacterised protein [Citrobacter freundii]